MTRTEFVAYLDVENQTLEFWLEQEWLVPTRSTTEMTFSDTDLARGRLIRDLKTSVGVNDEGIDIVLHLLDQLHGVRRAFEDLQEDFRTRGAGSDA